MIPNNWRIVDRNDYDNLGAFVDEKCGIYKPGIEPNTIRGAYVLQEEVKIKFKLLKCFYKSCNKFLLTSR